MSDLRSTGDSVRITLGGPQGMISLRADLAQAAVAKVCTGLTDAPWPALRGVQTGKRGSLLWMSPDEVLILIAPDTVTDALARIDQALQGLHHLAADVSDARAVLRVQGAFAREVIAKLAPVDLHPDVFGPGQVIRSRLGQIAAAFWMTDPQTVQVVCFRSVRDYAFDILAASAAAGPVGHFPIDTAAGLRG